MAEEPTKAQLYTEAQALEIEGRSTMDKEELAAAIEEAKADPLIADELSDFEDAVEELDTSNDEPEPEPEPESEPEPDPRERALRRVRPAPSVSQEATVQGGLTYMTDRAQ
jgi:hypothetical protein